MSQWTSDELNKIGGAEEVRIAPSRSDGTPRSPVTIWVVRVGDDLYIRSWRGRGGAWFRGAQKTHEGHVSSGGLEKAVTFVEETEPNLNDQIDAAYRAKYRRSAAYVPPMLSPEARATTLKLVPRAADPQFNQGG